jgi:uncharacterized protein involved in outer membrane biogenesis
MITPEPAGAIRPPTPRRYRLYGVAAVLAAVPLVALAILLTFDWNHARPWLNARTSEAIGRPFRIAGDLKLSWDKALPAPQEHRNWRNAIPWPHLVARDIHIGNPPDMDAKPNASMTAPDAIDMATFKELSFSLNPLALLSKRIVIPVLRFDTPVIQLLRTADGRNNWRFERAGNASQWTLEVERVVFTGGVLHLADAVKKADVTAEMETINADPAYGVSWKLHGTFNGAPVTGSGMAGAVLSLRSQLAPYPLLADVQIGSIRIRVEGTLTKPSALAALDMRLKVKGASMAHLYAFTGILLPETPPFSTEGHLTGNIGRHGGHWIYDKFSGKVGASDIAGKLDFQSRQPRGLLTADVVSHLLQFKDLGALIGADSNRKKAVRGVAAVQPTGKILPVEVFHTERWTSIDADVHFAAERIIRDSQLPIDKLSASLHLRDGVITLDPLTFNLAGGTLAAHVTMDGSGPGGKKAIKATARISARNLNVRQLFPSVQALKDSAGEINGDASLSATGNSVASLLGGANGEIKAVVSHGTISKLLLEKMGLNIANVILVQMAGDRQLPLNCVAADFTATNGLMQARSFIIDTDEAIIDVSGNVNLATENLDLKVEPDTKTLRIFSLHAPLYVRGPFSKPAVTVDKGVLALRAGGAIALAAVAPVAALLPLINAGPGRKSECTRLIAASRVKPVAPAPGKTRKGA